MLALLLLLSDDAKIQNLDAIRSGLQGSWYIWSPDPLSLEIEIICDCDVNCILTFGETENSITLLIVSQPLLCARQLHSSLFVDGVLS